MGKNIFAKGVEGLIDPISVGSLHFIESFNELLPKSIQKRLIKSSKNYLFKPTFDIMTFICFCQWQNRSTNK